MNIALGFVGGLVVWTLLEYVLHRFAGHQFKLGKTIAREHLSHHATPDYFSPMRKKVLLAIPVLGGLTALLVPLVGWGGAAVVFGTFAGWRFYEALHRATHLRGPRNAYGAWARRHHLHHHFQAPKANHGVTSPLWDWVFGTLERPETIRVPRRHARCFAWLLAQGTADEIDPRYARTYSLR